MLPQQDLATGPRQAKKRKGRRRSNGDDHQDVGGSTGGKRRRASCQTAIAKCLKQGVQELKSKFWDLEKSLSPRQVKVLRRSRIGDVNSLVQPSPQEEVCRAGAIQALRQRFAELCIIHGAKVSASTTFFDKWHCTWLLKASFRAIKSGLLAPAEPLLPMLGPKGFQSLDEALIKALAFLDKRKVAALAEDLRAAAAQAAAALAIQLQQLEHGGHAEVSEDESTKSATLRYEDTVLCMKQGHFRKLRALYRGKDEIGFVDAAFCCLLRYQSVLQKGFQGACTAGVFAALRETFNARFECFASPLNCRYKSMCSMFPDTDAAFGSLGSFFTFNPESGSFQLNPPFVDDVIVAMVQRLDRLLEAADTNQATLTFIVVVGANEGSRSGSAALGALRSSRFCRASVVCQKKDHWYLDGDQHLSEESWLSPCDTAAFILQSARGHEVNPASDEKMQHIQESFKA